MAQRSAPQETEETEDWLVTYADAITLLMAFFVMLLNFSKIDIPKFEAAAAGIAKEIGMQDRQTPMQLLKLDIQDVVFSMQADQAVEVGTDEKGVVMELASGAFYKPGSADIRDEAVAVLQKLAKTLLAPRYRMYVVEVEGHTDDDPISTSRFPSNWELSAGRATRVVRFFIDQKMEPMRLKATGFAETRPKAPNRDANGTPIPENQAVNRRVLVRVYPMDLDEREQLQKEVGVEEFTSEQSPPAEGAPQTEQPEAEQPATTQ